jgi:hypothetical protein
MAFEVMKEELSVTEILLQAESLKTILNGKSSGVVLTSQTIEGLQGLGSYSNLFCDPNDYLYPAGTHGKLTDHTETFREVFSFLVRFYSGSDAVAQISLDGLKKTNLIKD